MVHKTYKTSAWHVNLQTATVFLMVLTAPVMPRLNIAFLILLAVLAAVDLLALNRHAQPHRKREADTPIVIVAAGFVAYLFLNSLWARDTGVALGKAALVALITGTVFLLAEAFRRQPDDMLKKAARAATFGALIGTSIALFEFSTNHLLRHTLFEVWPAIRSESNALQIFVRDGSALVPVPPNEYAKGHENEVIRINTDALNRNLSLVLIYLWSVLAITAKASGWLARYKVSYAFLGATALTIFISASQTAQLALIGGLGVFVLARAIPTVLHWFLVGAWCVALTLTLPLASTPYKYDLHKAEWLFPSARDRIAIWSLTSELARETPILGVGIRSTRFIGREMRDSPEHSDTYGKPRRLGIHAHNHYLQVWYELGAVGAAFIVALGLLILARIRRMETDLRPYAYAAFATAALIASSGWGLWQTWLLAGFGLCILLFQLRLNLQDQPKKTKSDQNPNSAAPHTRPGASTRSRAARA